MDKKDAIKAFGTQADLARALGITPQAVHNWPEQVPARRAYEIERLTKGKLKAPAILSWKRSA